MILIRGSVAIACITIAGCASGTSPVTGELTVTVDEVTGVVGAVTVSGPNGYHRTFGTTQRLIVTPGSYTITAANVVKSDPIVGTVYTPSITGSPAVVTGAADTTATVTYNPRAGSGGLWIAGGSPFGSNTFNFAIDYAASELTSSSQIPPAYKLGFGVTSGTAIDDADVAFDSAGNLWVVNDGVSSVSTVVEYPASGLATNTSAAMPGVTIQLGGNGLPFALAFDANHNLWVTNSSANTIVELSASQLTASGSPTPAVTITESTTQQHPIGVAFDAQGNLWVANLFGNDVVEYTPSQLAQSGAPTPAVTITGPSNLSPEHIAFDQSGNLWIASEAGKIFEYGAAGLRTSGTPAPALTLTTPSGANAAQPAGLAFDNSGDLWYTDLFNSWIGEYTAAQLAAGGSPTPAVTIVNASNIAGEGLAFNPHSSTVPLH